jgi:hypothetical protein
MAWLYQRGKKWWIGYYDEDGKRVRKSISDTKEVAELALKRIEAELERKNAKSITVPQSTLDVIGKQLAPVNREPILTYPAVRNATNVRELFIRIYEKLGFEVLKSQEEFPNYILSSNELPIRAHAVLRSSDFERENLDYMACDSIICWIDDWESAPIPVLELSAHYDFWG